MKNFDSRSSRSKHQIYLTLLLLIIGLRAIAANVSEKPKPNIVIILADDMGFNDVSFHGSDQILTPNIDALAYNGIILNRHYVPNLCTPSRATLLTGKYPIRTGTQHFVIINDEPWGLPLKETLMPEIFRVAGYATNLVGKWHLGFWKKEYTPTMRGFDNHFGYYSGYIDYYNQTNFMLNRNYSRGLDLRRDLEPTYEGRNVYATKLFTDEGNRIIREHDVSRPLFLMMSHLAVHTGNEDNPMQAPEDVVSQFDYIRDPKRRKYAAMVSSLDQSVGETIGALSAKGILNNTIILFYSDNGAPTLGIHSNSGSNYPFRGQKETPWEGGIRSAGALWSPLLKQKQFVSNQIVHAIDWLPTLASAADVPLPKHLHFDGTNMWDALSNNREPQSRRLLHALDDVLGYSSYMRGNLKYVNGTTMNGAYDGWLGEFFDRPPSSPPSQMKAHAYSEYLLNSKVHRLINNLHADQLTADKIESLRTAATIRCSHHFDDVRDEIDKCEPLIEACFFNIDEDPCEMFNLAKKFPLEVALLEKDLDYFRMIAVKPARRPYSDPLSDPKLHNFTWSWWGDDDVEFTDLPESNNHSARNHVFNFPFLTLLVSFCFSFSLFNL